MVSLIRTMSLKYTVFFFEGFPNEIKLLIFNIFFFAKFPIPSQKNFPQNPASNSKLQIVSYGCFTTHSTSTCCSVPCSIPPFPKSCFHLWKKNSPKSRFPTLSRRSLDGHSCAQTPSRFACPHLSKASHDETSLKT